MPTMSPIRFIKTIKESVEITHDLKATQQSVSQSMNAFLQWLYETSCYMKQATEVGAQHTQNEDFKNEIIIDRLTISKGMSKPLSEEIFDFPHHSVQFNSVAVEPYITYLIMINVAS